jgi:ADP-ribose pyrophosphatase YjhB (NUDIX family)
MHQRGLEAARALPVDGTTPTEVTPEGTQVEPGTTAVEADTPFTKLDPNTLPAELQPYYKSMQADYTRSKQEIAPYRQLAEETGLDVAGLRQSAELYGALQDPQQLVQFYSELKTALEAQGLTSAEADVAATQHIADVQGGQEDLSLDPDEQRIQALESKLAGFEQSQQAREAAIQQQQLQTALIAEMNRQESVVKESHPDWEQEDLDAVYELSAFYGGSLIDAANRYDEVVSNRVTKILNGKGAVSANTAFSPLPAAVSASRGTEFGGDLDAAHKAAMAAAKLLP